MYSISVSHSGAVLAAAVAFLGLPLCPHVHIHLNICEPTTSLIMSRLQDPLSQTIPYQAPAFFANSDCTWTFQYV
jgi:hypothetical protein